MHLSAWLQGVSVQVHTSDSGSAVLVWTLLRAGQATVHFVGKYQALAAAIISKTKQ